MDPFSHEENNEFLTDIPMKGLGYQVINSAKCAIVSLHLSKEIGCSELVRRLCKDFLT